MSSQLLLQEIYQRLCRWCSGPLAMCRRHWQMPVMLSRCRARAAQILAHDVCDDVLEAPC
jgi:hypothetical protein